MEKYQCEIVNEGKFNQITTFKMVIVGEAGKLNFIQLKI